MNATEPRTIDFSRRMGVDCCISEVHNGGQQLKLYGWTHERLALGDFVILSERGRSHHSLPAHESVVVQRPARHVVR